MPSKLNVRPAVRWSLFASLTAFLFFSLNAPLFAASEALKPASSQASKSTELSQLAEGNDQLEAEIIALRAKQEARDRTAAVKVQPKEQSASVSAAVKPAAPVKRSLFQRFFGITPKTAEQIAAEKERKEEARRQAEAKRASAEQARKEAALKKAADQKEAALKKDAAKKGAVFKKAAEQKEVAARKEAETEKFFSPAPPRLVSPANMKGEMPRSGLVNLKDCLDHSIAVSLPKEIGGKRKSLNNMSLTKAIRDLFPEVTFNLTNEHGRRSSPGVPGGPNKPFSSIGDYRTSSYSFEGRQPLFRGFQLVNAVQQNRYNRKAAVEEIKKAVNESAFETLMAYFELSRASLVYQNHKEIAEEAARYLSQSEEQKKQGLISEIEYLNTQSLYSHMLQEVETHWGDKEVAAIQLKKALRLPPEESLDIAPLYDYSAYNVGTIRDFSDKAGKESVQLKAGETQTLDDYMVMAYKNRPDLKMEENKLIANRYAEKVAKGGFLPRSDMILKGGKTSQGYTPSAGRPPYKTDYSINIETGWNIGGNTVKHVFTNQQNSPSITTFEGQNGTRRMTNTFTAQLLDGLQQYIDIRQAKVQTLEQLQVYEDAERQTVEDLITAYYKYRSSVVRLKAAAAGLDFQNRSRELSKLKLEKNEIQISEYLSALEELRDERDQYHTAMADYFSSKAELNHAVGLQGLIPVDDFVNPASQPRS